jgi:hypothetical protein
MFKTVLAGKGCERAPLAPIRSVHFAREHGEGEYWMQSIELTEDQARAAIRMSDSGSGKAGD